MASLNMQIPITIETANLKLRLASSGEQYSWGGGGGVRLHLTQSETHLGERVKNTVVTQRQRLFKALCE